MHIGLAIRLIQQQPNAGRVTDYAALAVAHGLTVVSYRRGDSGLTGSSGTGAASWANLAGAASAITPHGSATNGIGAATAGLGGKAGLKLDGSTQKGLFTAPALAAPATTNIHDYWIARQASGGSGVARGVLQETGGANDVYMGTALAITALGANVSSVIVNDAWQRCRISRTGGAGCEIKCGAAAAVTGTGPNTAPNTARVFGDLLLNWEWLLKMQLIGPKANFLTFSAAADVAARTVDWTTAIQI